MAVTSEELMADAQRIADEAKEEIHYRFAATRYYYALYHRALSLANSQAETESQAAPGAAGYGMHQALRDFYEHCKTDNLDKKKLFKRLMYQLRTTHGERCVADYKLDDEFVEQRLHVHVSTCMSAIQVIDEIERLKV